MQNIVDRFPGQSHVLNGKFVLRPGEGLERIRTCGYDLTGHPWSRAHVEVEFCEPDPLVFGDGIF